MISCAIDGNRGQLIDRNEKSFGDPREIRDF